MTLETALTIRAENPSLADVAAITERILGFLHDHGVRDETFLSAFHLAAVEALNNSIEHGCAACAEPAITVTLRISAGEACIEIKDPSDFPGWTGEASLPEDPFAEGGRGRFIIESCTDRAEHELREGHHLIRIHKNLPGGWDYEPGSQDRVLSSMTEDLGASYEMINALIGLGELVASASEIGAFFGLALGRVSELTGASAAYVRMARPGGLVLSGQMGLLGSPLADVLPLDSGGVESRVFETGEEITVTGPLPSDDPLAGALRMAFVAPIIYKGDRRGVLVLALRDPDAPFFTAAQLQIARVVGEYLGIVSAINELQHRRESEQRALRELQIAAEIQMSLMPAKFDFSGHLEIFGQCRPALAAGGDYFDVVALEGGAVLVVIADVMGKGVSAALLAAMLRTNIRARVAQASDPGALLTDVNALMSADLAKLDMFITAACAWISPDASEIREANAGHPAGVLSHGGRAQSVLKSQGLPVGILNSTHYETHSLAFGVGDALVMFTDGLPEASDAEGKFFDEEGITSEVAKGPITSARPFVESLLDTVDRFSAHAPPGDDRTLLAVIRKN